MEDHFALCPKKNQPKKETLLSNKKEFGKTRKSDLPTFSLQNSKGFKVKKWVSIEPLLIKEILY